MYCGVVSVGLLQLLDCLEQVARADNIGLERIDRSNKTEIHVRLSAQMKNHIRLVLGEYSPDRREVLEVPLVQGDLVENRFDVLLRRPPPNQTAYIYSRVIIEYVLSQMAAHKTCYARYECFHTCLSFQIEDYCSEPPSIRGFARRHHLCHIFRYAASTPRAKPLWSHRELASMR